MAFQQNVEKLILNLYCPVALDCFVPMYFPKLSLKENLQVIVSLLFFHVLFVSKSSYVSHSLIKKYSNRIKNRTQIISLLFRFLKITWTYFVDYFKIVQTYMTNVL